MAPKIFFSYSHKDEGLRDELEVHLSGLKRQRLIDTWHDRRIVAGNALDASIDESLDSSSIILLLVSADFIASDYCYGGEVRRALARHAKGHARVVPVILRPCDWSSLPFGHLLALPTDGKPITTWADKDQAFVSVVQGIKRALTDLPATDRDHVTLASPLSNASRRSANRTPRPRSSNLRITKLFSDQEKDQYLHDSFEYLASFFEESLAELETRNTQISGRFRRITSDEFRASIYRNGKHMSSCTIAIDRSLGGSGISLSLGDQNLAGGWNERLSVDCDEQTLFLRSFGMLRFGQRDNDQLTSRGGAELFWQERIQPLQQSF